MSDRSIVGEAFGVGDYSGEEAVKLAYENLIGETFSAEEFGFQQIQADLTENRVLSTTSYLRPVLPVSREEHELALALKTLDDIFVGEGLNYANSITGWTGYQRQIEQHGYKNGGRALMIGSISPLSSRAFEALAGDVYGADSTYVVDLEASKAKERIGNFAYASGTALPFTDGSMNVIQTNGLLHMVTDPSKPDSGVEEVAEDLLLEIERVLAPGGQLLMQEMSPQKDDGQLNDSDKLSSFLHSRLADLDFEVVEIEDFSLPTTSDFMFDEERDFSDLETMEIPGIISLYARKKQAPPTVHPEAPTPYRHSRIAKYTALAGVALAAVGGVMAYLGNAKVTEDNGRINNYTRDHALSITTLPAPGNITNPEELHHVEVKERKDKAPVEEDLELGAAGLVIAAAAAGVEGIRRKVYYRRASR